MSIKDEFNYHAIILIFGRNSPKLTEMKIYNIDIMRQHPDIKFVEVSGLTVDNVVDINRKLLISPAKSFIANNCKLTSGTCRLVTFIDSTYSINKADALFSVGEYEYFSNSYEDTVKNKIRTLGMLIRSVYEGKLIDIPLLINEFPNITNVLLNHPDMWMKI
jgi:hypothetical protein